MHASFGFHDYCETCETETDFLTEYETGHGKVQTCKRCHTSILLDENNIGEPQPLNFD